MPNLTEEDYQNAEEFFFRNLKKHLPKSSSILLYCVTGSFGLGAPILGWSDIDILLVIDKYSFGFFDAIKKCLHNNKSGIHIGVTYYSLEEFNNKDYCKDPKTHHYVNSILTGKYTPRIMDPRINITRVSKDLIKKMDFVDFSKHLHQLKRELINPENYNEKIVYKSLVVLIKIMLRQKDIDFHGYKEVFKKAKENLQGYDFSFLLPEEIAQNIDFGKEERYLEYVRFLDWLAKFNAFDAVGEI